MKRILSRMLPHLTIILGVMTLVFYVVDGFNAVMAFMTSDLSKQVFLVLAVCAIISSIMLISHQWNEDDRKAKKAVRLQQEAEQFETADPITEEDPFEAEDFFLPLDKSKDE